MSKKRVAAGGVLLATGLAAFGGTAFADSGEPVNEPPQPQPQPHQTQADAPQPNGGLVNANVPLALDLHDGVANHALQDVVQVGDVVQDEKSDVSEKQDTNAGGDEAEPASTTAANANAPAGGGGDAPAPPPPPPAPESDANAQANEGGGANAVASLTDTVDGTVSSAQSSLKPTVDGVTSSASSTVNGVLDLNGNDCPK